MASRPRRRDRVPRGERCRTDEPRLHALPVVQREEKQRGGEDQTRVDGVRPRGIFFEDGKIARGRRDGTKAPVSSSSGSRHSASPDAPDLVVVHEKKKRKEKKRKKKNNTAVLITAVPWAGSSGRSATPKTAQTPLPLPIWPRPLRGTLGGKNNSLAGRGYQQRPVV
ncbi:hypothetical protein VTN02DRAFT_983 [Thermoascus thermophilus]